MPFSRREFIALAALGDRPETLQNAGSLILWEARPAGARAPREPRRAYHPIDVAVRVTSDLLVGAGPKRKAVNLALPGLMLTMSAAIDRDSTFACIAIGRTPGELGAFCGTQAEVEASGLLDPSRYVGIWSQCLPTVASII